MRRYEMSLHIIHFFFWISPMAIVLFPRSLKLFDGVKSPSKWKVNECFLKTLYLTKLYTSFWFLAKLALFIIKTWNVLFSLQLSNVLSLTAFSGPIRKFPSSCPPAFLSALGSPTSLSPFPSLTPSVLSFGICQMPHLWKCRTRIV